MKVREVAGFAARGAASVRPRHLIDVVRTARIRSTSGSVIVESRSAYTRRRFTEALRREGGILPTIIPCLDEAEDLPHTLLALARAGSTLPVVVDNGSKDETVAIAQEMGAEVVRQPTGRKMAATKAGIVFVRQVLRVDTALFTDGDTLPLSTWTTALPRELDAVDQGRGAAVFPTSMAGGGSSRLADLASSGLNQMYTVMHQQRGDLPIAHGHNYGLRFDAGGAVEQAMMSVDSNAFVGPGEEPDDLLIRNAVVATGAAISGPYSPDAWVVTRNERIHSVREVVAMGLGSATYLGIATESYVEQYSGAQHN